MIIFIEIDDTICYYERDVNDNYNLAFPYYDRIKKMNELFDKGNTIIYWSSRGANTNINWFHKTYAQLLKWNCKFHELRMNKPYFDLLIDKNNINSFDCITE